MATFYIDYENVHNGGTAGIEMLGNQEYVYLFYSQNANSMNMETVQNFIKSRCGIEFIEADTGTANSLDFQLITFLFTGVNQDDFNYIISKDHGFDAAIKMGKRMGIDNVKRYITISEAMRHYEKFKMDYEKSVTEECSGEHKIATLESLEQIKEKNPRSDDGQIKMKDQIRNIVLRESNISLLREELEISYDGLCCCENKMKLYHYLRSQLGDKRGRAVYGALNDEYTQLRLDLVV